MTKYVWMDGALIPLNEALVPILSHTLHYGTGVFEGLRLYKTLQGSAVFTLKEHIDRLFYSFEAFHRTIPFTKEQILKAVIDTIKINQIEQAYIRPLVYFGHGSMALNVESLPIHVVIALWPWGKHYDVDAVRVKTSQFIRLTPASSYIDRKIIGHYVNSVLSHMDAKSQGYQDALLLDHDGFVAEGPAANIFFVQGGTLKTPKLGSILPGITRSCVLAIARDLKIPVEETCLTLADAKKSDEAFFTGTAIEISPIKSIDETSFGYEKVGPITKTIQEYFESIISGKNSQYRDWLTFVE